MLKGKSIFKDIINVGLSNIITLIGSVVTGLVVPVILGATNYGYYRTFTLYATYTALLHFGFVDGVLLKHGGEKYQDLNKRKFRSNSVVFIFFQLILSLILISLSIICNSKFYSILLVSLGINLFLINITTYYRFVSQAVMRFSELSFRNSIQALLTIFLTLLFGIFYKIRLIKNADYIEYIIIMLFIYFIIFVWYLYTYHDITFGKHDSLYHGIKRVIKYCKIGIYITISFQVSNLVLIVDNQFVSIFFKAHVYGIYSFSFSMITTAVTVLTAVSTVLLPHLKQKSNYYILHRYPLMISYMFIFVYSCLIFYFPFCKIVRIILPAYTQSLIYFRIFLPGLALNCCVTMIIFNYYNVLNKSKFYFYISLMTLFLAILIDVALYMIFRNSVVLAFGSFIAIFIWYVLSEYFLIKWYHIKWLKNFIYMVLMISSFFLISIVNNLIIGFSLYLIVYLVVSWLMFRKIIKKDARVILNKL